MNRIWHIIYKVDLMTESFKIMRTSNEALKTAVDATLKYQWTMESIAKNRKERKRMDYAKGYILITYTWMFGTFNNNDNKIYMTWQK